jgi:predicted ATPase
MDMITNIEVKGFKSFRDISIPLGPINVLIGANGSGKSNLISLFRMLNYMIEGRLQEYIGRVGGANSLLYYGGKTTSGIEIKLAFSVTGREEEYHSRLAEANPDTLIFTEEKPIWQPRGDVPQKEIKLGAGYKESLLFTKDHSLGVYIFFETLLKYRVFQFHDTSDSARIRLNGPIDHNQYLYGDASNLAAYLYMLKKTEVYFYNQIVDTIRLVAPHFSDFELEPQELNSNFIMLKWREVGNDYIFGPHQIPDGLLRFMALATLLRQPRKELPKVIIIDEPELGLHPAALTILAAMIRSASHFSQIVLATQSVSLVENFEPKDIVVLERQKVEGRNEFETIVRRVEEEKLAGWLKDYSIGELWEKNILGGRP